MRPWLPVCLVAALAVSAQVPTAPVVNPRGVVNAFTQQPAPTSVAAGGIIWINGINLGPAAGWKAEGSPLPTRAGDPPVEVRLGNRAIPLYSITPGRIVAQIPVDTPAGLQQIVVRRGEQQSRPARFVVSPPTPSVTTANGNGFGAAGRVNGNTLTLRVTGLGQTDPPQELGALPAADTVPAPRVPVRANVGGSAAEVAAELSNEAVGEFTVRVTLPETVREGDVVHVYSGTAAGNRVTVTDLSRPVAQWLPLPAPSTTLRGLVTSDLRPGFSVLSGPRSADGCWPATVVDFDASQVTALDGCYTAAQAQAVSPFVLSNEGAALAALVGPPEGTAAEGISNKVAIFAPGAEARVVELPGKATTLNPAPNGNINAVIPAPPARAVQINPANGEITEGQPGGGGGVPGGGGGGGLNLANLNIDLGDGVKTPVSAPVALGQGVQVILAVDDIDAPKRAKFATLNAQLQVQTTVAFPDGWLPLLAPPVNLPPGQQPPPGGALNQIRSLVQWDGPTRQLYVLSRAVDNGRDAFVRLPAPANQPPGEPAAIAFPQGVFAANCTQQLRAFNLELSRRLALATTNSAENTVRNPCGASGFLTLDLATRELETAALPGTGQINMTGNSANEVNDYVYGANTSPATQNRADTLFVFDGVTSSSFRIDLPSEVSSFANLTPFAPMGILFAQATRTAVGDAGIVIFDLESASGRLLPTPAGFASVQPLALFPVTRKLIARGTRTEPVGNQILIYDLVTNELTIVPSPEGVTFLGQAPNAPGQPGQPPGQQQQQPLQSLNPKSNSVTMVGYNAQRQGVGVFLVRVP